MSRLQAGLVRACVLAASAHAEDDLSPRLRELRRCPDPGAIASFWAEVARTGSPLVEPVPDRADYSYVTFLWRGSPATRNVLVTSPHRTHTGQRLGGATALTALARRAAARSPARAGFPHAS